MDISKLVEFSNSNEFYGICNHKNSIYRISLKLPAYPLMKNSKIHILKNLHNFTFDFDEDTDDITDFLKKFDLAVNTPCEDGGKTDEILLKSKREDILNQLALLRRQETYDISVASDFTAIRIYDKTHYLNLSITKDLEVVVSDHSLPECKFQWFQSTPGKIESYLNEFTRFLEQLEEFYSNINAIDELCFVVDPVQPTTKSIWRIFKIDQKCYAKVVINPLLPSSIGITFIGPSPQVEEYRNKYEAEVSRWDDDLDVHKNLLKICGLVYFPMRTDQDEDDLPSCSICGIFRLNNCIPMISCDNTKCDLVYHVSCLRQWWSMFIDSKTFLFVELGTKCPMCKEKLSTSFEQLLTERDI